MTNNNCPSSDEYWKDPDDPSTKQALYVLAGINILVIAQGIYTFTAHLKMADTRGINNRVIAFYAMALSCLLVAEIYFVSGAFATRKCF